MWRTKICSQYYSKGGAVEGGAGLFRTDLDEVVHTKLGIRILGD